MKSKPLSLISASIRIGVSHKGYGGILQTGIGEILRAGMVQPPALIT
jgi:hypothetical protein